MASDFSDLLTAAMPRLLGYAITLTRDRALADDLLQNTALNAWRAQSQFTLGTNFLAWIHRILRNEYLSGLRRSARAPISMEGLPPEVFARAGNQETHVMAREVFRAMDKLERRQREALLLASGSGLGYRELSEILKCSVGTIKSRLWRARGQMQKLLMEEDAQEAGQSRSALGCDGKDEMPFEHATI